MRSSTGLIRTIRCRLPAPRQRILNRAFRLPLQERASRQHRRASARARRYACVVVRQRYQPQWPQRPGRGFGQRIQLRLAPYLTTYSRELNVDNEGNARINLNGRDLKKVYTDLKTAVGEELAAYLVAYRLYDLPSSSMGNTGSTTPVTAGSIADLVNKVEQDMNGSQTPRQTDGVVDSRADWRQSTLRRRFR